MSDTPPDPFARPADGVGPPDGPPPGWAPPGWTPGYAPQAPSGSDAPQPPPGPYVATPAPRAHRPAPAAAPVPALVGFAVLVGGLFALPLNDYRYPGTGIGFVETRQFVEQLQGRRAPEFYSGLATAWWLWGALTVGVVVVVLLALAVARIAPVPTGILLAIVALAGGVVHWLAMARSIDYRSLQELRPRGRSSFFDHPGIGVWVSLVGFALVLAGGIVIAVTGRRR